MLLLPGPLYSHVLSLSSPLATELVGTALTHLLFFWLPSAALLLITYLLPPHSAIRSQPSHPPPSLRTLQHCVYLVLKNQLIGFLLQSILHLFTRHFFNCTLYSPPDSAIYLTPTWILHTLILPIPLCELIFYYFHRILHTSPSLYRRIHSIHHEFSVPIALAAQYSHPIEYVLTAWMPIMVSAAVARGGLVGLWAFMGIVELETAVVHSGLNVGALARRHDRHHEGGVVGGYATFEVVDWMFGTGMREVGGRKVMGMEKKLEKKRLEVGGKGCDARRLLSWNWAGAVKRWKREERIANRIENTDM